jgi:hypothetical protein
MSVPSMRTVVANLKAAGEHSLAEHILREAVKYKCPNCNMATANPGIALGDVNMGGSFAGKVVFYCPWCSGEAVRPDGDVE